MREILFRGKHSKKYDDGESWIYGVPYFDADNDCIMATSTYCCVVSPETVGEYTGLSDKNGKKIFTGDIVKHHFGEEKGVIKLGEYRQPFNDDIHTKHIGFYVDWISGKQKDLLRKDLGYWAGINNKYDYKIFIGNIHDNPELLRR